MDERQRAFLFDPAESSLGLHSFLVCSLLIPTHQAPLEATDVGIDASDFRIHFYLPLLRSVTVR